MSTMQNIKAKIKRKLSIHDKNPNLDEYNSDDDVDEETTGHLHRDIERAEGSNEPHGKPGSFLNRLIMHGNKKTEDQIAQESTMAHSNQTQLQHENQKPTVA